MSIDPTPFFVKPGEGLSPRRLLLISYHFPPSTSAGALRWQKFARHAEEFGWGLDVVTLDPADLPALDWDRMGDMPPGTRVFGIRRPILWRERAQARVADMRQRLRPHMPGLPGERAAGQQSIQPRAPSRPPAWMRAYNAFLDYAQQRTWTERARHLALRLVRSGTIDAVVTCGPPHLVHRAGQPVAAAGAVPHVMDMRDPWRLVERLADPIDTPVWRWMAAWHERRIVPRASLVVTNTDGLNEAMRQHYPRAASRIVTVMNGFDDDPIPPTGDRDGRFVIAYAGTIYLDRDPGPLFQATAQIIERRKLTPADLGITLVGTVEHYAGGSVALLARQLGLERFVTLHPHCSRRRLWEILSHASMLVSLGQDSHLAIPSKVFEYMQFESWLLALAEPHSATARLLLGTPADVVSPGDVPGIAAVLEDRFERFRRGERPPRLASIETFGRSHQAGRLFERLGQTVGGHLLR